jgi:hypothetical protein
MVSRVFLKMIRYENPETAKPAQPTYLACIRPTWGGIGAAALPYIPFIREKNLAEVPLESLQRLENRKISKILNFLISSGL